MKRRQVKDMAASVHQRLLNKAQQEVAESVVQAGESLFGKVAEPKCDIVKTELLLDIHEGAYYGCDS